MESNKTVLKTTTLLGGVQGLNILLNIVRTKLVAIFLGPEGIGLNSIFNETRELLHTTTNFGFDASGIRGISISFEKLREAQTEEQRKQSQREFDAQVVLIRSWVVLFALLGIFVCMLLAAPLSYFTFRSYAHTTDFLLLSPVVGFSTFICGEMVLLRAIRRLKAVALISTLNIIAGIVVTIPIYYFYGVAGVIPALILFFLAQAVIVASFSFRYCRPSFYFGVSSLKNGVPMIKLGLSFVVSGMLAHGMELFIQSYINGIGSEYAVGLYRAGYTLTATYAGMVFAAFDTDFFPRLTGIFSDVRQRVQTVCQQLEIVLVLIGPILVTMIMALPMLLPLLYTDAFCEVLSMAQISAVGILFKAIYLPAVYLPLAAGHSRTYLFVQIVGSLDMLLIVLGYQMFGLWGAGLGVTAGNFLDMLLAHAYARFKYGVRLTLRNLVLIFVYLFIVVATYLAATHLTGLNYWLGCGLLLVLCCVVSVVQYKHVNFQKLRR